MVLGEVKTPLSFEGKVTFAGRLVATCCLVGALESEETGTRSFGAYTSNVRIQPRLFLILGLGCELRSYRNKQEKE